jgi:hypothetical protein
VVDAHALAAWLWGSGFDFADQFGAQGVGSLANSNWIATITGPRSKWAVYVKSGIHAASDPAASVTLALHAYLLNETHPSRDRINPKCTVPPFKLNTAGDYLFSRDSGRPIKQAAQCQREFFSKLVTTAFEADEPLPCNIFGGPWNGQLTHSGASGLVTSEVKGFDADVTNGLLISTVTAQEGQVNVPDPLRYDWLRFDITNGTGAQNVDARVALTSPTR